jgi:hypothetical protein
MRLVMHEERMGKRAAFRVILTGTLLCITLVTFGVTGVSNADAPKDATNTVVNGAGGAVGHTVAGMAGNQLIMVIGFAVLLSVVGAGLGSLARRPVR